MERLAFTYPGSLIGPRSGSPPPRTDEGAGSVAARREPEQDRLAFRALIAFLFVLLVRPQDDIPLLAPIHLADIFAVAALLALVLGRLSSGRPSPRMTPELAGVLAFASMMLVTVPLSFWPGGSLSLFADVFVKIVLIFIVMVTTLTTRERLKQALTVIVLGATYVALRAIVDYARGANLVEGGRIAGALGGLFRNPNDMALNMVSFLPLAIAFACQRGSRGVRLLGLVATPAMLAAIVFSKSRGGTVGLLAMGLVMLFQMRRLRPGVAVALVAAGIAAVPLLPATFTERMASIFDADQDPTGSRQARKTLLREGWDAFLDNPLTGIGAGQFPNYKPEQREAAWRQTHNTPLQVASELGIVGLALFGFLVWSAFAAAVRALHTARRARSGRHRARAPALGSAPEAGTDHALAWIELHAAMILAAVTGWFAAALFGSVAYYWTFYLLLALAASIRGIAADAAAASRQPNVALRMAS